jgi:tripeptidyl-peptidase-2
MLPSSRVLYQLVLRYNFTIDSATTITARFPTVMNQLYEHFLAGVFGIVYDTNRKVVGYLDVFDHNIKLSQKGEYTIMLQLSTEEENVLEKLKDVICELDLDLKAVNFNTFQNIADAYKNGNSTLTKFNLERKNIKVLYIAPPAGKDALPKDVKAGDALFGKLTFMSNVEGGQYKVIYTVPPLIVESKSSDEKDNKKPTEEEIERQLKDATRDLEISYLKKFEADSTAYKNLLSKLETEYVNDINFLEYKLNSLWTASGSTDVDSLLAPGKLSQAQANEIIKISDTIISQLNERELSEFYGLKQAENETDEQKQKRKENDQKKKQLINALKQKAIAYAAISDAAENLDAFNASVKALQQWTSDDSSKDLTSLLIKVKQERKAGHPGNALKAIEKYLSEASFTSTAVKDVAKVWKVRNEIYKELGWTLWSEYDDKWNIIRQPPYGFALF